MTTRTVYRVEHKEHGYGPYLKPDKFYDEDGDFYDEDFTTHYDVDGLHDAHNDSDDHPGPRCENLNFERTYQHVFGFDERKLADAWFKGFKRKLHAAGFVVNVYEAPAGSTFTGDSGRQCIFRKDLSRLVDTQSVIAYSR